MPDIAPAPNTTGGTEPEKEKHKVVITYVEGAVAEQSRDAADAAMTARKSEAGFFKRIWKHNIFREYYRQKEIYKAREEILKSESLYKWEGKTASTREYKAEHENAMEAIVNRFTQEYETAVSHEAGEWRHIFGQAYDQNTGERKAQTETAEELTIKGRLKDLITQYAKGSVDEDAFQEEKVRIFQAATANDKVSVEHAMEFADNLLKVAERVKQKYEHDKSADALDFELDITLGKARAGVRTEAQHNRIDRLVEKMNKTWIGRLVSESTMAAALAATYGTAAKLSETVGRSKLAAWGTFGTSVVLSTGIAAARESHRLEEERRSVGRSGAKGEHIGPNSPRRAEMGQFNYEMERADALANSLGSMVEHLIAADKLKTVDHGAITTAISQLAAIESRINLSDRMKIDLLSYSSAVNVEMERTRLIIVRGKAREALRRIAANSGYAGIDIPGETAAGKAARAKTFDFDAFLKTQTGTIIDTLIKGDRGIEKKNEAFKKMKRRAVAKRAAMTLAIGLGIGAIAQEGMAFFNDNQEGLVEHLAGHHNIATPGHEVHQTVLRSLLAGHETPGVGTPHYLWSDAGNTVELPQGYELQPAGSGAYQLLYAGKVVEDGLHFNNGQLDSMSRLLLQEKGVASSVTNHPIFHQGPPQTTHTNASEYIKSNHGLFHHIKRMLWYDNDTPKPVFDKNELRLDLQMKNDNPVFNVARMTADGSYHGPFSADAMALAAEGKLKMAISLSQDTQTTPIFVDINPDGTADLSSLPTDIKNMIVSTDTNGHLVPHYRFAEVVQMMGSKGDAETVRVLATAVGPGATDIETVVPGPETIEYAHKTILDAIPSGDHPVDAPWFVPILGRTPLEPLKAPKVPGTPRPPEPPPIYSGFGNPEAIAAQFEKSNIPFDPYSKKVRIVNGEKESYWVNEKGEGVKRDIQRERQRINTYLKSQEGEYVKQLEGFKRELPPMNDKCRVAVIIPARFESLNLANLLDQYAKQTDMKGNPVDPETFEINIIVNRKESEAADNSVEIIKEWKKKHPAFRVNIVDVTFKDEEGCVGRARKYITDLTLLRSHDRRDPAGPLYIESEDADLFSVDKRIVAKLTHDFDANPEVDVLRGIQDRRPDVMQTNDLLFFRRRFWDFLELALRKKKFRPDNNPNTNFSWNKVICGGWNTAYTAEAYAQIGGYATVKMGEDMNIGEKISVLRGHWQDSKKKKFAHNVDTHKASGLRSNSSPRRFVYELATGKGVYDEATFEDQQIKKLGLDTMLALPTVKPYEKANKTHAERYTQYMSDTLSGLQINWGLKPEVAKEVMTSTLLYLGLRKSDFKFSPHTLTRKDTSGKKIPLEGLQISFMPPAMERIIGLLERYREEGRWEWGYQRQGSPHDSEFEARKDREDSATAEVKSAMDAFWKKDTLSFKVPETIVSERDILDSPQKEEIHGYTVDRRKVVPPFEIYPATKNGKVYVFKERTRGSYEEGNRAHRRLDDVDSYLNTKGFSNPSILKCVEKFEHNGKVIRVYEAKGTDLENYFAKNHDKLPLKQMLSVIIRACDGVRALHADGVVHMDIHPKNILLSPDGLVLNDLDAGGVKEHKGVIYSRNYMFGNIDVLPPELLRQNPRFGKTADVYELGGFLYWLVVKNWPFADDSIRTMPLDKQFEPFRKIKQTRPLNFPAGFPDEIKPIVKKCLEPLPQNRYQSMAELQLELLKVYEKSTGNIPQQPNIPTSAEKPKTLDEAVEKMEKELGVSIKIPILVKSLIPKTTPEQVGEVYDKVTSFIEKSVPAGTSPDKFLAECGIKYIRIALAGTTMVSGDSIVIGTNDLQRKDLATSEVPGELLKQLEAARAKNTP